MSVLAAAITRYSPALFFTVVALFYTLRIIRLKGRLGRSPVTFGAPRTLHRRLHLTFRIFRILIWLVSVLRAAWPPFDAFLVPLGPLWQAPVMLAGNLLMWLAFALIVRLNLAMGPEWRSGLPEGEVPPLRTEGAFAWCRHPMFTLVMLAQLGLFLAIPSLFTLVCLVVGIGTILKQAALEEAGLARRHGERWRRYRATTPKWPWSRKPRG